MREINVAAITKELFDTNLFVTREFGQLLLPRFDEIINSYSEKVFIFDFSKILYVDFSCPHEVFSHIIPRLKEKSDRFVFLKGLDQSKRENIDIALSEEKIAMIEVTDNSIEIRGHLPEYLSEILIRILHNKERLTARQLADESNAKISTTSSKLLTLWKQGLVDREEIVNEEGKQFIYKSVGAFI